MKNLNSQLLALLFVFISGVVIGQPGTDGSLILQVEAQKQEGIIRAAQNSEEFVYSTTTYTFEDIVLFSYFDSTTFYISKEGVPLDTIKLNKDEFYQYNGYSDGIYTVGSNNSFTILIGDAVTNKVMGYFAVDESGRAVSTHLNTYMPSNAYPGEHFIVFSYQDQTEFSIINLTTGLPIASGILNEGEHFELNDYNNTFIGVRSSKPVSALSYTDQGYYVPSNNGTFSGTRFFGFSGYVGYWPNSVIITAYDDETAYVILDSSTGDTLEIDTLARGTTNQYVVNKDTYWEVRTSKNATVNNTPYGNYSGNYAYLTRQIDESGTGLGTNFYAPHITGDLNIVSHEDGNLLNIIEMSTGDTVVSDTVLNKNDSYYLYAYKDVYHITGTENLSVISATNGGYGADFVPLSFSAGLPDLAISGGDIKFTPDSVEKVGEPLTIEATVHNYGFEDAINVEVLFFDGDTKGGQQIGKTQKIASLPAGESKKVSIQWKAPENIEYHAVYVSVDEHNVITESNSSNNVAFKFLIPNNDLLPPLAASVIAPGYIFYDGQTIKPDSFAIKLSLFNTGDAFAEDVRVNIILPENLVMDTTIKDQKDTVLLGDIKGKFSSDTAWHVVLDKLPEQNYLFYSIFVHASNAPDKILERMLVIGQPVTNIKETYAQDEIVIFPNPFSNKINIGTSGIEGTTQIDVFDMNGRKVMGSKQQIPFSGTNIELDTQSLPSGIYFIRLRHNDVNKVYKAIKE